MASTAEMDGQDRYITPSLDSSSIVTERPESWSSRWSPFEYDQFFELAPWKLDLLELRRTCMPSSLSRSLNFDLISE